jgi:signal peptidase II
MPGAARASGLATAIIAVALDQAHKAWMLGPFALPDKGRVELTPFLDLVMVWNRGVSYGLLTQEGGLGRFVLIAIGIAGAFLFGWWLWSTRGILAAASLGLIIGGALSNVVDRVRHGAVADFFLLHAGSFEWYVFNLADVWIVAGVMGLMLSWAMERPEKAKTA